MSRLKFHFKLLLFCFLFVSISLSDTYANPEDTVTSNKNQTLVANSNKSTNNITEASTPLAEINNAKINIQTDVGLVGKPRRKDLHLDEYGNSEMPKPDNVSVSSPSPSHLNTEKSTKPPVKINPNNDRQSTTQLITHNDTAALNNKSVSNIDASASNSTATLLTNSSSSSTKTITSTTTVTTTITSTTTSTTEKPKKPTLTHSVDEDPDAVKIKEDNVKSENNTTKNNTSTNEGSKPKSSDSNARNKATGHAEYVVPVVITIFAVPLFVSLTVYCVRQGRDYWEKRHYRRMDFLIDGMYND